MRSEMAAAAAMLLLLQPVIAGVAEGPAAFEGVARSYADRRGFTGVVVVARRAEAVYQGQFGQAERAFGAPVREDTRFPIASISKAFVATAILQLEAAGRLELDAPARRYLPELPDRLAKATVRQLLTHTTGLPRETDIKHWETVSSAEHVRRIAAQAPVSAPGERYGYSNAGYVLLGRIVEVTSGLAYVDYLQSRILAPAGLNDTGVLLGQDVVPRLAYPYRLGPHGIRGAWRARQLGTYAPGGLYSTSGDLLRFVAALQDGRLLPKALAAEMFTPRIRHEEGGSQWAAYGWDVNVREGVNYLVAAGSADGGKAVVMHEPGSGLTVVILSNFGDAPVMEMLRDLTLVSLGAEPKPLRSCDLARAEAYDDVLGAYDFTGTGLEKEMAEETVRVSLTRDGPRLFLVEEGEDGEASLLCPRQDGRLGLSFTNEIALDFAERASAAPVMVWTWSGKAFRARRER